MATTQRPQLNLDELHQLKWLLGGALTLLSVWTVFYMDVDAWTLMFLITGVTTAVIVRPMLPARVPPLVHTLAFPAIVAFFAGDLWLRTEVLPAMVRLDMLLLLYRSITYRQRRDDLQIIVLGLFLIVVAGVLTVSLTFAVHLLLYTACALTFLLLITLIDSALGAHRPPPQAIRDAPAWAVHADWPALLRRLRQVTDWRVVGMGAALFAGVVAVSALLFLTIPRFQIESGMFLDRFISKKTRTGFSDTIRFGDVTEITQDNSVALSVDVSDQSKIPASPYWRMIVLDAYDHGTFRLSAGLRRPPWFEAERTSARIVGSARPRRGLPVYWTFYLESGVSRFLPLLGPFVELNFQETQNYRFHRQSSLVVLREEPVTMTAYRVQDFEIGGEIPDPAFAQRWKQKDQPGADRVGLQIRTVNQEADVATLMRIVSQIRSPPGGGPPRNLSAGEFAQDACAWLRANHAYSLSPVIPAGDGDSLVRWLASREAGHCELFAGSLVLLARTAGFPAHVVTGFRGGSWNAYSNNFTIHNADAHAWTEVFDERSGAWLREDALGTAAEAEKNAPMGAAAIAARADRSWTARFDSLRIFWYRRIVSFDQQAQAQTLKAVKQATENSGKRLREAVIQALASAKTWLTRPWDSGRITKLAVLLAAAGSVAWGLWRLRFALLELGWRRSRGMDPVRREASRWMARMADCAGQGEEAGRALGDLQRLRFGAREGWPEPDKVFRRARRVLRASREKRKAAGG